MTKTNKIKPKPAIKFELSSHFESLLRLRDENPKAFAIQSQSTKIALDCYLEQKKLTGLERD